MPIQSSIKQQTAEHCVVRNYDQDGVEYTFSFFTVGVIDVDSLIAQKVVELDAQLAEAEFNQIVGEA